MLVLALFWFLRQSEEESNTFVLKHVCGSCFNGLVELYQNSFAVSLVHLYLLSDTFLCLYIKKNGP